jgi:hypothetical protein
MHRFWISLALLLATAMPSAAHPGVGLVMDRQGNVFYTDLAHVWRIAPNGRKSIAVRNVHTHELALDAADDLYGEDLQFQGGGTWRRRLWMRTPAGVVRDVVPWRSGFPRDFGVVRDRAGTTYWVELTRNQSLLHKRSRDGHLITLAPQTRFGFPINWLTVAADGSVYVADGRDLRRIDPNGKVSTLAQGLSRSHESHALGGMSIDPRGNVYVAVYGDSSVVRVTPNGKVETVARSAAPWSPSGVLVAPNGDLWILEYSTSNAAHVRRVVPLKAKPR